jgi:hypothetical protein
VGIVGTPSLLRQDEARFFLGQIEDPVTQQLIEVPYREVIRRFDESSRLPITDFDLAFFVQGLFLSCSCHERIAGYLNGIDHRWFPEDDDEMRLASFCPLPDRRTGAIRNGRIPQNWFSMELLLRWHEAKWFLGSVEDVPTIQIVGVAVAALDRHLVGRRCPPEPTLPLGCPLAPVDLLFTTEVLIHFASQKEFLRSVLSRDQGHSSVFKN